MALANTLSTAYAIGINNSGVRAKTDIWAVSHFVIRHYISKLSSLAVQQKWQLIII